MKLDVIQANKPSEHAAIFDDCVCIALCYPTDVEVSLGSFAQNARADMLANAVNLSADLLAFVRRVADPNALWCPATMTSEARELVRRAEEQR